jgi:hypothetical protein
MPVFKLIPIDREDPDWRCSSYCGEALVRAETEHHARALAARTFGLFDPIGEGSCLCPWTSEFHTRCETQGQASGDGVAELLHPKITARHAASG